MNNNSKIASFVLAGLAIGAVAYYLFGTSTGKELCDNLMDKAKKTGSAIKKEAKDKFSDLSGKVTDMADKVNSRT